MNLIQIMTYGGEDQWIRLGLREFPKTTYLILICKSNESKSNYKLKVAENKKFIEMEDHIKLAKNLIDKLKEEEKDLPKNKRRNYYLLTPPNTKDHHELIRFFRELIKYISGNGEKILINTTLGQQVWKLALYQVALEHRRDIEKFYLIKKDTGEIKNIRLYRRLKEYEIELINIIFQNPEISITKLHEIYFSKFGKGNLTFISRTIKELIKDKLVKEKKVGRTVHLNLTGDGESYMPKEEYKKYFEKNLKWR